MSIARNTLAAIHVAKKELGLDDDTYRDVLHRVASVRSAAQLDESGARRVMAEFDRLGFAGRSKKSHRPIVAKARAQWIALHNLDEIDNPHDRALDAFGKGISGKEALSLSDNTEVGKVVEALKAWLTRVGVKFAEHPRNPLLAVTWEQVRRFRNAGEWVSASIGGDAPAAIQAHSNQLGAQLREERLGKRHQSPNGTGADHD